MDDQIKPVNGCLQGKYRCEGSSCTGCGWNEREARRRRSIPMTYNCNGLLRKSIGRQTKTKETAT